MECSRRWKRVRRQNKGNHEGAKEARRRIRNFVLRALRVLRSERFLKRNEYETATITGSSHRQAIGRRGENQERHRPSRLGEGEADEGQGHRRRSRQA